MFVAPEDHTFVARDFSSIESKLVGWFAGSKRVVRLSSLDMHSWFMAHAILYPKGLITAADLPDVEWPDDQLKDCLKALKQRFVGDGGPRSPRSIAKRVIYLSMYAGTPGRMHEEYPETFQTKKDAALIQGALFNLLPEIPAWHHRLCNEVDKTTTVRAPDGFVHHYYRVLQWKNIDGRWQSEFTDDAKRLIAFLPQHMAAFIGKEAGKRLYYSGRGMMLAKRINPHWHPVSPDNWTLRDIIAHPFLRLFVHDEWLCECPVTYADELDQILQDEMEVPIKELPLDPLWNMGTHLMVGTEGKMGQSWGDMK